MAAWPGLWRLVPWTILLQVVLSLFSIGYLWVKRRTASRGDADAARVVILPVFEPLLWTCLICQVLHFSLSIYTYPNMPSWKQRAKWEEVDVEWTDTLQYWLTMTAVNIEYNIIAALYMQTDLSHRSIRRSVYYVVFYALTSGVVSSYCYHSGISYNAFALFDAIFFVFESAWYTWLLARSMIVSRSTFLVYALYSLLWRLLIIPSSLGSRNGMPELYFIWVAFRSLGFSPCLYYTLWNETQYWRGNSAKSLWLMNREIGDMMAAEMKGGGGGASPGLKFSVISDDLPELLKENKLIDFAFLRFSNLLDSGSHSKVYKGKLRGKPVAIKLFTPPEMDRSAMRRFIEETRIASKLKHPHIVKLYGIAVRPPDICMVVEYCEKGSLFKLLSAEKLSLELKLRLMVQAASALAYLHSLTPPIIHRDVKSHNFLVTDTYMVKLADFGESRIVDETIMTGYIGSHAYMSPEIITSAPYNTKADVYSFGIVLWEVLTQQRPYEGIKQMSVLRNVVKLSLRPPLTPDIPNPLTELLRETWAANPESRPSARQVIERLLQFSKLVKEENNSSATKMSASSSSASSLSEMKRKQASSPLEPLQEFTTHDYNPSSYKNDNSNGSNKSSCQDKGSIHRRRSNEDDGDDKKTTGKEDGVSSAAPLMNSSKGSKKRWLLQNLLTKELKEVERQLNDLAVRKLTISEQLQLQCNQQLHAQPLTRSMSIGGYGSLRSKSNQNSPERRSGHLSQQSNTVLFKTASSSSSQQHKNNSGGGSNYYSSMHAPRRSRVFSSSNRRFYSSDSPIRGGRAASNHQRVGGGGGAIPPYHHYYLMESSSSSDLKQSRLETPPPRNRTVVNNDDNARTTTTTTTTIDDGQQVNSRDSSVLSTTSSRRSYQQIVHQPMHR